MDSFGFIITRHVNSEITNKYWNHSIKRIRTHYPTVKIVVIDDNSNQYLLKADFPYKNLTIINSEFLGRGELLPYYYYIKNKFFENAVIIHDSVFFHKKINFHLLKGINVIPLWHFHSDKENISNTLRICDSSLNPNLLIKQKLSNNQIIFMNDQKWYGCFGVQSFINHTFLLRIEEKYKITNLITSVQCREDRSSLERIMGCIFFTENPKISIKKSLFGDIMKYQRWGYSFNEYIKQLRHKKYLLKPVIKVWTGR